MCSMMSSHEGSSLAFPMYRGAGEPHQSLQGAAAPGGPAQHHPLAHSGRHGTRRICATSKCILYWSAPTVTVHGNMYIKVELSIDTLIGYLYDIIWTILECSYCYSGVLFSLLYRVSVYYCMDCVLYAMFQTLQFKLSEQPCQHLLVMDGRARLHEGGLKLIGEAQSHDTSMCLTVIVGGGVWFVAMITPSRINATSLSSISTRECQ